jgi:hypothetical protein
LTHINFPKFAPLDYERCPSGKYYWEMLVEVLRNMLHHRHTKKKTPKRRYVR